MSDKYYRGLRNFLNDTKYKLQFASMTLEINENKNNVNGIKSDITDNLSKISNLEKYLVSSNGFNKVYKIKKQIFKFDKDTNFFKLIKIEIKHDFTIDSLLIITNHLHFKYDNLNDDYHRCQNEYNIYNEDDLIHTYIFNHDKYYNENLDILYTNEDFCIRFNNNYKKIKIILDLHRHNRHGVGNIDLKIDDNSNNYLNIDYLDKNNENSDKILSNLGKIDTNTDNISSNLGKISTNEGNISSNSRQISTNEGNISSNSGQISTNEENISSNSGQISANEGNISSNSGQISTNEGNISSNLEKINDNKDDILSLQNSNVKAFYNLEKIFIYDIEKGDQNVNKDNYHIFEKEIIYNFIKDSYLEIILKVLTEVSNYVLIGFFQILCNFYDENDDLFYTISLSTAMGSINKLSTIKSVFIVPISKSINKIKIDFLLCLNVVKKIDQLNLLFKILIVIKYI